METTIVFIANPGKVSTEVVRKEAMQAARDKGYTCLEINDTIAERGGDFLRRIAQADFLVSIGGDGTILRSVAFAAQHRLPILGINTGRVGFLSEVRPDEFPGALDRIAAGRYTLESRMMLQCSVNGQDTGIALNEILLYRHSNSGTAHISQYIDGWDAGAIFCDGIIVCTPTGATGYSISAGGPVVAPGLDACIITPICPHTLTAKPIIASSGAKTEFLMNSKGILIADGDIRRELQQGDRIRIHRAEETVQFIRFAEKNLFQLIKEKLI